MQRRTDVAIDPPDADADGANGDQVALQDLGEIIVTVTSADGSRSKTYRVRFPETGWDPASDPWQHCLRGAVSEGLSLVVYEAGSVEELASCAESRGIVAVYALHDGAYVSYILGGARLREPALPRPVRRRPATHDAPGRQERGAARRALSPVATGQWDSPPTGALR